MPLSNFIQLEIWFTVVGRNLGGKYLERTDRFRLCIQPVVRAAPGSFCCAMIAIHRFCKPRSH